MEKSFICSLCRNGILGGALYITDSAVIYRTNKITVDRALRNITLPLGQIAELTWRRAIFPIARFRMMNGAEYKFIIFNKRRFNKYYAIATSAR